MFCSISVARPIMLQRIPLYLKEYVYELDS